jgi:hypothetical protein
LPNTEIFQFKDVAYGVEKVSIQYITVIRVCSGTEFGTFRKSDPNPKRFVLYQLKNDPNFVVFYVDLIRFDKGSVLTSVIVANIAIVPLSRFCLL